MPSFNALESLHVSSLAELGGIDAIEIFDESRGEVGLGFGDIPLTAFEPGWANLRFDPEMLRTPLRFSEISVHWESADPLPELSGEYRVPAPLAILSQGPSRMADMMNGEFQRAFVADLRTIDDAYDSSSGFAAYLHMVPDTSPLPVWFQDLVAIETPPHPPGFFRLDLTYVRYMEALVITKGVHGWQYLFADVSLRNSALRETAERLKGMMETFPTIFPEHDYRELAGRLEARL